MAPRRSGWFCKPSQTRMLFTALLTTGATRPELIDAVCAATTG